MKPHIKFFIAFLAIPFLSACQTTNKSDRSQIDSVLSGVNPYEGIVILSHRLDGIGCSATMTVKGITSKGSPITRSLQYELYKADLLFPQYMVLKTLPAGKYKITNIDCAGAYKLSGLGLLAKFEVETGKVHNLGVLQITKKERKSRYGGAENYSIERVVKPYSSSDISKIQEKYPDIVKKMIYTPMSIEISGQDVLDALIQLKQDDVDRIKKLEELLGTDLSDKTTETVETATKKQ